MSTSKKKSLVISGTDKYHNPHSYTGNPSDNYVAVEVKKDSDQKN